MGGFCSSEHKIQPEFLSTRSACISNDEYWISAADCRLVVAKPIKLLIFLTDRIDRGDASYSGPNSRGKLNSDKKDMVFFCPRRTPKKKGTTSWCPFFTYRGSLF